MIEITYISRQALYRRLSFAFLALAGFIAVFLSTPGHTSTLTPHKFTDYPAEQIYRLVDRLEIDNISLYNCYDCEPIAVPDYVVEGMVKLIELQPFEFHNNDYFHPNYGDVSVRSSPLRENELAVVVDYHLNYSHIFSFQKNGHQIDIKIDNSYPVSNGIGGMADRRRSGGTPGGVHFVYYKQNTSAAENEIVYAKDTRLIGKIVAPAGDQWWRGCTVRWMRGTWGCTSLVVA